jgi:Trk K+ transport system NAD-binding subunit
MKIIILGAGQVGASLAASLASEANDITVVDSDGDRLRELGNALDIRTVQGHASHPNVLRDAGGADADMLIAVTNSDEVNMVPVRWPTPISARRDRKSRASVPPIISRAKACSAKKAFPLRK